MLIKSAGDRARDIETLQALLLHPATTAEKRSRIEIEIRNIRAGAKGEAEAAYEIEFHHKASKNWAVIHDLRLEWQGRVAQIDHLLINRFMDCWVCETKHFSEGFAINEHGEFTAFYGGRPKGIASPIEQNRKHIEVLRSVLNSPIVELPTRLGLAIKPTMKSVILVSKNARIQRPKAPVDGIEAVIKSDTLRTMIEKEINDASVVATFMSAAKMIGQDTLEALARQIAKLRRPIQVGWAGRFGLGTELLYPETTHKTKRRLPWVSCRDSLVSPSPRSDRSAGATKTRPGRTFNAEFKLQVVQMIRNQGLSVVSWSFSLFRRIPPIQSDLRSQCTAESDNALMFGSKVLVCSRCAANVWPSYGFSVKDLAPTIMGWPVYFYVA